MADGQSPVPADHPLMKAWEAFKASEEFANAARWASYREHLDGSLWAVFDAGWHAGVSAAHGMEPIYTERTIDGGGTDGR